MTHKKSAFLLFLSTFLFFLPFQSVHAENEDMDIWLKDTFNPEVTKIVEGFNETAQLNWYVNLSTYLIEGDKKDAVKSLKVLRDDISDLKKGVKAIETSETADKKERKQIKAIKKNFNSALNRTDGNAKRLIKKFDKDKKVKSVSARKSEQKSISKASNAFIELNEINKLEVDELKLDSFVKIDKKEAEIIVRNHNDELKRIAEEKLKKKKEDEAKAATEAEKQAEKEKGVTPLFDINDLVNKTEVEIEKILGMPTDSEVSEMPLNKVMMNYKVNFYEGEKLDVMFVEGKSVNVFLYLTEEEYFTGGDENKNLGYLNLPIVDLEKSVVENQTSVSAYDVGGFYRVQVGEWRNARGGSVSVFTEKEYNF